MSEISQAINEQNPEVFENKIIYPQETSSKLFPLSLTETETVSDFNGVSCPLTESPSTAFLSRTIRAEQAAKSSAVEEITNVVDFSNSSLDSIRTVEELIEDLDLRNPQPTKDPSSTTLKKSEHSVKKSFEGTSDISNASVTKKSSSETSVKSVKNEQKTKGYKVDSLSEVSISSVQTSSESSLASGAQSSNEQSSVTSERKAKIHTIEELIDSSSDLDFPDTPPPQPSTVLPPAALTSPQLVSLVTTISLPAPIPPPATLTTPAPVSPSAPVRPLTAVPPLTSPAPKSKFVPVTLVSPSGTVTRRTSSPPPARLKAQRPVSSPVSQRINSVPISGGNPPVPISEPALTTALLHSLVPNSVPLVQGMSAINNNFHDTNGASANAVNENRSTSVSPTPTTGTTITSSGGISINHYERLIEELKCPGCASPMKAPIKLCASGHSICESCTNVLMLCPLCKEPFIDLRSLTLEALCSKAHFRCSHAAAGCSVRLQHDLLNWHEKQCIWKPMKCFMGRVWGDCNWTGREAEWKDHLETEHSDKVFTTNQVDLMWNMNGKVLPLAGYYVFEVYNEMFNFYQVYDRDRILFTMTVTSTTRDRKLNFAYEVEMFHKNNEALVLTQRFPVHSEYDKDILLEGTCVCVSLSDLARLIGPEKVLHYRVRVQEVKSPIRSKAPIKPVRKIPIDYQQTNIEGANLKCVPAGVIFTRKLEDIALGMDPLLDDEEKKDNMKRDDTESSDDPEFEAFIEKNWGTPQLNFNRRYLRSTSSKESTSSSGSSMVSTPNESKVSSLRHSPCEAGGTKSKMKNVTTNLRKSFRSLKTDIIELKKPFIKKSPEKRESLIKK